jgi:hypothetical protein
MIPSERHCIQKKKIEMNLRETEYEQVHSIKISQNGVKWLDSSNTVMNVLVH